MEPHSGRTSVKSPDLGSGRIQGVFAAVLQVAALVVGKKLHDG